MYIVNLITLYISFCCSVSFFTPWHREPVTEAKFTHRRSLTALDGINIDDDEDAKSVASMHELYESESKSKLKPEVSSDLQLLD